jgi:predicted metal-binding membrane protein
MNAPDSTPLESLLRRDRWIVAVSLAGIAAVAWVCMAREAGIMNATGICRCAGMVMSGPDMRPWDLAQLPPLFLMWSGMMVAMMIPSAAPMILVFAAVNRRRRENNRPFVPTAVFLSGYVLVWTLFSAAAALAQWALHATALLSPRMGGTSPVLGGAILVGAGAFQWTSWKKACLTHCRSPLAFVTADWREGTRGALWMGLKHGALCAGCCWLLMALLFVAGVMNMWWVAILSLLVLLEKTLPKGLWIGRLAGLALIAWGLWVVLFNRAP